MLSSSHPTRRAPIDSVAPGPLSPRSGTPAIRLFVLTILVGLILTLRATDPVLADGFQFTAEPVPMENVSVTNWYGNIEFAYLNRTTIYGELQGFHSGLDFLIDQGTPIKSTVNRTGKVISLNSTPYDWRAGPGNVAVDYGEYIVLYGHTMKIPPVGALVKQLNDEVKLGDVIAYTGKDDQPVPLAHLHLELIKRTCADSRPGCVRTNPVPLLSTGLYEAFRSKLQPKYSEFHQWPNCSEWLSEFDQPDITPGGPLYEGCKRTNTATVTDITDPDTYSCSQPGHVDFEGLPEGTDLSSGTISGLQFTTTNGYTWRVGDFATGYYNGKYPRGGYTSNGTRWAWLGVSQGAGRVDFPKGPASYISLLTSDVSTVYLDAYNSNGTLLATAGPAPSNYGTGHMHELKITRAARDISYVMVHDTGNYFLIDDVCTDAPATPNTIKRLVDRSYFMQSGQRASGYFIVDALSGMKQLIHIMLGPYFSDVDLIISRPDGSIVSTTDPGIIVNETPNTIEVFIDSAAAGVWNYEIVANQLEDGGENLHMVVDEQAILVPNTPPALTLPGDQTGRYSDVLTFDISADDPDAGDSVALSATGLPAGLTFTDNGDRTGTVAGVVEAPAGTYPVTFSADDGENPAVPGGLNIVVVRERAVVTPWAGNPSSVKVNTPGGPAGPITVTSAIAEAADDTSKGDISKAVPVTYTLTAVGPGGSYSCAAVVTGGGVGGTLSASCTFPTVAVNVYDVHVEVGGDYYTGSADSILSVYDPSLGFTTGGGTIVHNGVTASFGFNSKYLKNGQTQGSLVYIEHRPTGDVVLKSNAMGPLVIVNSTTAYVQGKATLGGAGNFSFRATVIDNGEPGTSDQLGLQVEDPSGVIVAELSFSPITLTGGNSQVPRR